MLKQQLIYDQKDLNKDIEIELKEKDQYSKDQTKKFLSFDDVLEDQIKDGKYQVLNSLGANMFYFADGVETFVVSYLVPLLEHQWKLTYLEKSILSSSIFIGVIIGTLIGGYIGDKMGRRLVMISAQFFILIFGFLSATANNVLQFAVWRLLTTIGIGLGMSVCSSFIVEIFQKDKRGKIVILTCIAFSAGALVFSWMASVILTDLKNGNWRMLVIYSNIFSIFALLLTVIYQKESPRFLLFDRQFNQAFMVINYASRLNDPNSRVLSNDQKTQLINWVNETLQIQQQQNISKNYLFMYQIQNIRKTVITSTLWILMCFTYYAFAFVMPLVVARYTPQNENENLNFLVISMLPEITFICILYFIIEKFGRKNLIQKSFLFSGLCCFLMYFFQSMPTIIYILSFTKAFQMIGFDCLFPYSCEIYVTQIRSIAFSLFSTQARIAGIFIPMIIFPAFDLGINYFITLILILEIIGFVASLFAENDSQQLQEI